MIVGSILNLTAIEMSTLLQIGHIDTPIRIYKKLFEAVETTDSTMDEQGNSNILFRYFLPHCFLNSCLPVFFTVIETLGQSMWALFL